MLLVTEDDRTLYVGTAGRMLWRYRSELAPLTAALILLLAGAWAHSRYSGWAFACAALTAAFTTVLVVPPAKLHGRLADWLRRWPVYERRAERLYAASVVGLAGGWLSAATWWGPGAAQLPTVLLLGTAVGGLPWWTHRRRRARVRVTRTIEAWPTFAESVGLPGSRLLWAIVDRWGWSGRLALRRGQTSAQAIAAAPGIESALGVRPGAVRLEPDLARADRAVLRVIESDPLAVPITWSGLSTDGTTDTGRAPSILDPIDLGVFEDGTPVLVQFAYRNALVGGMIGSGKSGVLNVLLAFLVACRDAVVWGIDLKGGMELGPWAAALGRLATTPAEAIALARDSLAVRDQRTATARARLWEPGRDGPALIVLVDEYAELPDEAKEAIESLSRIGRAVMVNVLPATQRPTQDAMGGGATRAQMAVRICLQVKEKRDTDLILDRGSWAAGWRADLLDAPGKLLLSDPEHKIPRVGRCYLISDAQVEDAARACADRKPTVRVPEGHPPDAAEEDEPSQERHRAPDDHTTPDPAADADRLLLMILCDAPKEGTTVAELIEITGMSRATIYRRLRIHADNGNAVQLGNGRWRSP